MAKKMTDMLKVVVAAPEPEKDKLRNKAGEEIITLSLRITRPEWKNLMDLMTEERMKVQPYLRKLIEADFGQRGIRF